MARKTKQRLLKKLGIEEAELELLCLGYGAERIVNKILSNHRLSSELLFYHPLPKLLVKANVLLPSEAKWIQSGAVLQPR